MIRSFLIGLGFVVIVATYTSIIVQILESARTRATPQQTKQGSEPKAVLASWYGKEFHGKTMANGKRFDMHDPTTVAHKLLPFGTRVLLENPSTGRKIYAVVRDRGPYIEGREFDLSYGAAIQLGIVQQGVAPVHARVIGPH